MRGSDEIMAEYLLKGAKMLGKTCPECGSPLFTVNGETYCVVCRENKAQTGKAANNPNNSDNTNAAKGTKAGRNTKKTAQAGRHGHAATESESDMTAAKLRVDAADEECTDSCGECECDCGCEELRSGIEAAMTILCRRIKSDTRPEDCVALMQAVSIGADILKKLE